MNRSRGLADAVGRQREERIARDFRSLSGVVRCPKQMVGQLYGATSMLTSVVPESGGCNLACSQRARTSVFVTHVERRQMLTPWRRSFICPEITGLSVLGQVSAILAVIRSRGAKTTL